MEGIGSGEKKEKVKGSESKKREAELKHIEARGGIDDKWAKFAVARRKGWKNVEGGENKKRKVEGRVVGRIYLRKMEGRVVELP